MARPFDLLRGKFRSQGYTQEEFAKALGKSRAYISKRLNRVYAWDAIDIAQICELLKISTADIPAHFELKGAPT